jgi:hypothetical protein
VDWLPRLVRAQADRLLLSIMADREVLDPAASGLAPGRGGVSLEGRVDSHAVAVATTLINPAAVGAFLARIGQDPTHSVSRSDRIEDAVPDELAMRRICRPLHLSRWADGDLESFTITHTPPRLTVVVDESDSMDALGPHALAGVVWAHALVGVMAPGRAICFGGDRVREFTPGWRLGGSTDPQFAAERAANDTVVIITDGHCRLDRLPHGVSEWAVIWSSGSRLATRRGQQTGLVDLI